MEIILTSVAHCIALCGMSKIRLKRKAAPRPYSYSNNTIALAEAVTPRSAAPPEGPIVYSGLDLPQYRMTSNISSHIVGPCCKPLSGQLWTLIHIALLSSGGLRKMALKLCRTTPGGGIRLYIDDCQVWYRNSFYTPTTDNSWLE